MTINLKDLAEKVRRARDIGAIAARAQKDDGGSSNLDHVVLCGLKGVREASMRNAGVHGYRSKGGTYHLADSFGGQGNRRYAGVQAMYEALKAEGVDCYVHYQMD